MGSPVDDAIEREFKRSRDLSAPDVLALVEIARAARDVESWRPQLQPGLDALHPQERDAIIALRSALARLDSGATEGDA